MKLTIKIRIWLLGLIALGGLVSLLGLHFAAVGKQLMRQEALIRLLDKTEYLSRAIHELQRERGLSSNYLASGDATALIALTRQHAATDRSLYDLEKAYPEHAHDFAGLAGRRIGVTMFEASPQDAFDDYSGITEALIEALDRTGLAAGGTGLQADLMAHVRLVRAKEFLGQTRATLLSLPGWEKADAPWIAAVGRAAGLFEWQIERFRKSAAAEIVAELDAVSERSEMVRARRILAEVMAHGARADTQGKRTEWFESMTAAIDLLRGVESDSLQALQERAGAERSALRWVAALKTSVLLVLAGVLTSLALSSLRQMRRALDVALRGTRRATRRGGEGMTRGAQDEVGEIERGYDDLLDQVERLTQKAATDALTGALNRRGLVELAAGELQRARRHQRPLAAILFDLDRFKRINDYYGHATGDMVLKEVAQLVRANLRLTDLFVRWGGEEFVILASEIGPEEARLLAEKLRALFHEHRREGLPAFTASFGVASLQPDDDVESLVARADQAMYQAKQEGRDRVVCWQAGPQDAAAIRG